MRSCGLENGVVDIGDLYAPPFNTAAPGGPERLFTNEEVTLQGGLIRVGGLGARSRGAAWQDLADLVPHLITAGYGSAARVAVRGVTGRRSWRGLHRRR